MIECREVGTGKKGLQKRKLEGAKREDLSQKMALKKGQHSRHNEKHKCKLRVQVRVQCDGGG